MKPLYITIILILTLPCVAFSQDTVYKKVPQIVDLQEVTVQAEKVTTKLQETPIAISMIAAKKIEQENINTMADLSARIPNFFVLDYGSKMSPPIYLRGMGLRRDVQPSVGLYVDNIPYFEKGSFNFEFLDIDKIEVLRGPQGTLYGRNTMGGLIKIYTQDPKALFGGYIRSEYGSYNQSKTILHINQPLSSKFYTVFNAGYSHGDGFFLNHFTNKKADEYNSYSGRLKLAYRPNNNFKATLSIDFERNNQLGYAYATYDTDSQKANDISYNKESAYDRDQLSIGLNMEYIGNWFVLNSATSYQNMDDVFFIDQDFSPANLYFIDQDRTHNTYYQEVNIHSKPNASITWLFGTMFFKQLTDKGVNVTYGDDFINARGWPYNTYTYLKTYDLPTTGFGLYGQSTVPFGKFNFTGGLRLDLESADLAYTYTITKDGVDDIKPGFDSDLKFDQVTPKASLSYVPSDNFTAYFLTTKGFKAGGFNFTFETDEDRIYGPETSWNYEFGIKSTWLNKRLTTNLSLFHIDIDNQQVAQPVPSGQGSMTKNAGTSKSQGVELEANIVISNDWQIWTSFGYTDAKFTEYVNTKDVDLSDKLLPNVPKFTFGIGTNYSIDFEESFIDKTDINVSYQHMGKMFWDEENTAFQKSYGLTNAKITFVTSSVDFGLWGKNIFGTEYNAFYFTSFGNSYVQLGKPAQFGIFAKLKF